MWLTTSARGLERAFYPIVRLANRGALLALVLMTGLVFVDVVLRTFFNSPIYGSYELTEFLLLCLVFLSMANTEVQGSNIRVDVILRTLSDEKKAIVEVLYTLMPLVCFAVIAWQNARMGFETLEANEISGLLEIPLFPFYWLAAFGCVLLTLVYLVNLLDALATASKIHKQKIWIYLVGCLVITLALVSIAWWPDFMPFEMSPAQMGVLGVVLMMVLIFTGMPIGPVLAGLGFLGFAYLGTVKGSLNILATYPLISASNYTMAAVPLFVLMGMFCYHSELSSDIYATCRSWFGRLPGGLSMATVGACAGFAAVSGSSMASVATMGTMALPEMRKYKYDDGLATGCIAAGASIGILIPPSIPFIIYAMLTEESTGELFFAGIIPGIMEAIFYIAVIFIICRLKPSLGPRGDKTSFREKIVSLKGTAGILILFVIVIGGIYMGVFTPSEAAGIGACGALIIGLVRKRLTWAKIVESITATITTTCMILFLVLGGDIFALLLATSDIPFAMANFVTSLDVPPIIALILILFAYAILGFFMPIFLIIILTVPIFLPVIVSLGYSPIWVGVLVVMMAEMGAISPPFGMNAFVMQGVAKDVPLTTIYRGVIPFVLTDVVRVALVVIFPALALFMPSILR